MEGQDFVFKMISGGEDFAKHIVARIANDVEQSAKRNHENKPFLKCEICTDKWVFGPTSFVYNEISNEWDVFCTSVTYVKPVFEMLETDDFWKPILDYRPLKNISFKKLLSSRHTRDLVRLILMEINKSADLDDGPLSPHFKNRDDDDEEDEDDASSVPIRINITNMDTESVIFTRGYECKDYDADELEEAIEQNGDFRSEETFIGNVKEAMTDMRRWLTCQLDSVKALQNRCPRTIKRLKAE